MSLRHLPRERSGAGERSVPYGKRSDEAVSKFLSSEAKDLVLGEAEASYANEEILRLRCAPALNDMHIRISDTVY